jgi:DNA recombination protein RmuC
VVGLQDILANKQARGAFGEIQLRDIVEATLPPSAYEFQATLGNGRRADCLLRLPNPPGPIAIDAKFPLESYNLMQAAENDADKVQAARAFDRDMRKHIQDIAERYIIGGETAEAALMFLPSEAVYAELHARFPGAVEQSFRMRVFIVSPTTLWATLNTVRAVFKDVRMREQASIIQREVHVLMQDVGRLDARVGNLATHFRQAGKDIEEIQTSTRKITGRGERIEALELEDEVDGRPALPIAAPETERAAE